MSKKVERVRGSLKGGSLHTEGAKTIGTITREMEKKLGRTPIRPEVFKKTHVKKIENEPDSDVWVEERIELTFAYKVLDRHVKPEALDGVQIAAMLAQIAQLTSTLAKSKRRRVAEQQSMSVTV
ncbi:hypothetical protein MTR67_007385 [Solanum verrucosum]|uniref:Uncharacterized protein n=1 Tax=Solanum verrucosum TaxID=315347 RepID=A0AAF0Q1X4_SOLVR|nr:hypothetical protein MTR67_007385 [Solanum verrucosum]